MKRILLIISVLFSLAVPTRASHFMGGEIYWVCLPNGYYQFHMRVYQECAGILYSTTQVQLQTNVPGLSTITLYFIDTVDISPVCAADPSFPHVNCESTTVSNSGGVREWIYQSDPVQLPNSVPPVNGWYFAFDGCCRNPCSNIIGTSSMNWFLRAIMYPYNGMTVDTCYDNSPVFAERPAMISTCDFPQSYNHNGYDIDGDSLTFEWAQPWTDNNTPIPAGSYQNGYTWDSPLPGTDQCPLNIPAVIDPNTGEISFLSFTTGAFVTSTKCSAYRNGIHISDVYREIQIVLMFANGESPPDVTPAFPLNTDQWVDTVYPGTLVNCTLLATDTGYQLNGIDPQVVSFTASGAQFGDNFTSDSTGCLEPPCATLSVPPPNPGAFLSGTTFSWQTTCDHLSFGYGNNDDYVDYYFVFRFTDDYCPVPAFSVKTIKVVVQDPLIQAPVLDSFDINQANGNVTLFWETVQDPFGSFDRYNIYFKGNLMDPYTLIDSIPNISQATYTHTSVNANNQYVFYVLETQSGCPGRLKLSAPSNEMTNYVTGLGAGNSVDDLLKCSFNPSDHQMYIQMNALEDSKVQIEVFNILGMKIVSHNTSLNQGFNKFTVPIPANVNGIYTYRISTTFGSWKGKLSILNR